LCHGKRDSGARYIYESKTSIAMAKATFGKEEAHFTSRVGLNLGKELVKCRIWSIALYGAETWTLQEVEVPGKF
jgi:hypothetical protein